MSMTGYVSGDQKQGQENETLLHKDVESDDMNRVLQRCNFTRHVYMSAKAVVLSPAQSTFGSGDLLCSGMPCDSHPTPRHCADSAIE